MKQPTKIPATERPKALDVLVNIVDLAVSYRFQERTPTLTDLARVIGSASRVLRYADVDERISTENAALLAIAKQRGLVG